MNSSERQRDEEKEVFKMSPTKVWRSVQRCREPEHFLLIVESFSVLSECKIEKFESDEFEAGGYKWRLILYPKGDKKRNGSDHISLYLSISDTKSLSQGWEVKAHFTLFVYNNIFDKYQTFQVGNASARRFHELKTEWGFAQLFELDYFKENSNGFLFDDTCVFGAEVFVSSSLVKRQRLSMIKNTNIVSSLNVANFSTLEDGPIFSNKFKFGEFNWMLSLYPKGYGHDNGKSICFFLEAVTDEFKTLAVNWKTYAEFKLRIKNLVTGNHFERQGSGWFDNSGFCYGFYSFMNISDLNDKTKGFILEDTLYVEVEITIAAMTKNFE